MDDMVEIVSVQKYTQLHGIRRCQTLKHSAIKLITNINVILWHCFKQPSDINRFKYTLFLNPLKLLFLDQKLIPYRNSSCFACSGDTLLKKPKAPPFQIR